MGIGYASCPVSPLTRGVLPIRSNFRENLLQYTSAWFVWACVAVIIKCVSSIIPDGGIQISPFLINIRTAIYTYIYNRPSVWVFRSSLTVYRLSLDNKCARS
jgi:hypothetical protein